MLQMASMWSHIWVTYAIYALTTFIMFCSRAIQYKCTKISYSRIAWTGTWNCKIWVSIMFIGPCIIAVVDKWKTNLMSLAILFHLLRAQHVSDISISIFRSLRLCRWITASVVLFSVRCVLELLARAVFGGVRFAGWSLQNEHHPKPAAPKAPTHNELRTRRRMW